METSKKQTSGLVMGLAAMIILLAAVVVILFLQNSDLRGKNDDLKVQNSEQKETINDLNATNAALEVDLQSAADDLNEGQ